MNKVTIKVPATTANLGPGFDTLGCALTLHAVLSFERTPEPGLTITGCDPIYAGRDNLAYVAFKDTMDELCVEPEGGLKIHIQSDIPVSRGFGSSAALLVAGAMGANELYGGSLTREQLLAIVTRIEGHPDNLAPAIYGGLTASLMDGDTPVTRNFPISDEWQFITFIPDFPLATSKARAVLPDTVSRSDSIFNTSHAVLVLRALADGDLELLRIAMQDRLHQDYRRGLIPGYDEIEDLVCYHGGAFAISGAGPILLCVAKDKALADAFRSELPPALAAHWRVETLGVSQCGAVSDN